MCLSERWCMHVCFCMHVCVFSDTPVISWQCYTVRERNCCPDRPSSLFLPGDLKVIHRQGFITYCTQVTYVFLWCHLNCNLFFYQMLWCRVTYKWGSRVTGSLGQMGVKHLAQGDTVLPNMGLKLTTFWSQAHSQTLTPFNNWHLHACTYILVVLRFCIAMYLHNTA